MRPGPAAKPTIVKLFEGNRGHQKLNKNEPKFSENDWKAPDDLGEHGKAIWDKLCPQLTCMGLLDSASYASFVALCRSWQMYCASEKLARTAMMLKNTSKSGEIEWYKNPAVNIAKDALADYHRLSKEFGLTPSSRSTLEVPNMGDKGDEFDEI